MVRCCGSESEVSSGAMSHQFPGFKLITLIARQMSSPIATRVKNYAKAHPLFSRVVCASVAEIYRYGEWRVRVLALRAAGRRGEWWTRNAPPPLSPNEAREMGGDLIGEIVIFILGSAIVIYEFNRQAMMKEEAEEGERVAWAALLALLEETRREVQHQQQMIDRLRAALQEHLARSSGDRDDDKHSSGFKRDRQPRTFFNMYVYQVNLITHMRMKQGC